MEDSERKKAIELLKEMRSENKTADNSGDQESHLNWMYKGPSDLIDREEYLLGRAIDKNFEALNSAESSDVGTTGEQSNVPKRLLEKTISLEQVDVDKKILEDPLYAIKQKEMEARRKLLSNPVKLKQIKQMLLERSKQNSSHKQKKKLKQKSEQDLNFLILKKLSKFTDKEKRKALNKILKSDFDFNSTESSSSSNTKDKKLKSKKKKSYSSSDEYDLNSEKNSNKKFSKKKRKQSEINKKNQNRRDDESNSNSSSSDYEKNKKSRGEKLNKEHSRQFFDLDSGNSAVNEKVMKSQNKDLRNLKNAMVKNKKRDLKEENTGDRQSRRIFKGKRKVKEDMRNSFSDGESRFKKSYGLMVLDGSRPKKRKRDFPVQKHEKSTKPKTNYVPSSTVKPLSDKEREEKLREMMENAKMRKQDREKNLANHRKKQTLEEESKIYDEDFMRRQMSHLTSQGTMADRIKSNINNIQRSKSSMDINFMRK